MDSRIENWLYNKTKNNRKKMLLFVHNHYNALDNEKVDPLILNLFNRTTTPHLEFNAAYDDFSFKKAVRKGLTAAFENKVAGIPDKATVWEAPIVVAYGKGSPEYIQLFPNGRTGLYKGSYEVVISNVHTFYNTLDTMTFTNNPVADVLAYYNEMTATRAQGLNAEEGIDAASDLLNAKLLPLAETIFGNWGALIDIFRATPDEANRFFDYSILKSKVKDEEEYNSTIAGGDNANIISEGIEDNTQFLFEVTGSTTLRFFTSDSASGTAGALYIDVAPGTNIIKQAIEIGESGNTFLNVTNLDPTNQGKYKVTMF